MKHEEITEKIIQAFYKVYNTLGYGFLEKVYLNAMFIELTAMGFKADKEKRYSLLFWKYRGDYNADLIVEDVIAVELKATNARYENETN